MNEIFDRLLIRILLTSFVCLCLYIYKFAHIFLYPSHKKQTLKLFYPSANPADTTHLYSRMIGIAIIYSSLGFNEGIGFMMSSFHFIVWGTLTSFIYLISLYIMESIVLSKFEYKDEVLKKGNMVYAVISLTHSLAIAIVLKSIVAHSENSMIILFILWLLSMVIMGFVSKYFSLVTKLSLNKLIIQKNLSLAFSYLGFTLGTGYLMAQCFDQGHFDITMYCIQVILKMLLCLIIFPLFNIGLKWIFKANITKVESGSSETEQDMQGYGYGIYEGCLFLTACLLTSLIVNKIQFGTIYPFF